MPRPMKISSEGTGSRSKKRLSRMQIRMTHPISRRGPFKRITNLSEIYLVIGRSVVLPTRDACRHSAQQTLGPFSAARLFIVNFHYMRKHGASQLYESTVFGRRAGSWLLCVQSKTGLPRKIRSRPVLYAVFSERASGCLRVLAIPVQEGHNLGTGAGGVGAEAVGTNAGGDAFLDCPGHSVSIVSIGGHIRENGGPPVRSQSA